MTLPRCLPLALLGAILSAAVGAYASVRTGALATHVLTVMNDAVSSPDSAFTALDDVIGQASTALRSMWQSPSIWLSIIGTLMVGIGFHGALIAQQSDWMRARAAASSGVRVETPHWLRLTMRRVPSLLQAIIILMAAAALAALLLGAAAALGVAEAIWVAVLILIVGTWLWGRLQLWLVAMFAQDLGAVAALQASWRLVRGHWWRVSTLITFAYLAVMLISAIATLPAGVETASGGGISLPDRLLALASAALTAPLLPAVWLELYGELAAGDAAPIGPIEPPRPAGGVKPGTT